MPLQEALSMYLTGKVALEGIGTPASHCKKSTSARGLGDTFELVWEDHLEDNPETKASKGS